MATTPRLLVGVLVVLAALTAPAVVAADAELPGPADESVAAGQEPPPAAVSDTSVDRATSRPSLAERDPSNLTLEELQAGGEVVDERYPSLRVASETVAFWMVRYPPSGFNSYGGEDAREQFLEPTSKVRRNRVRLFATHPFDGENHNYTLRVVYWNPDTRQVTHETENGTVTRTERYANVTGSGTQDVGFGPGFQRHADLNLRGHYGDGSRVTVFMQAAGKSLQWTFRHQSIRTAQPINIDTRSDLYSWVIWWIILPTILLEGVVAVGVRGFRERARAGTGHSPWFWIALGAVGMFGVYLFGYVFWASLVAAVPFVFAIMVAWTTAAFILEADTGAVERWAFVHMDPEEHPSPLDRDEVIKTASEGHLEGFAVVETESGEPALYHTGLAAMWARYRGEYALLELDNYRAEFDMTGDYDKLVVVDPDVDEVLAHERTRWLIRWPWRTAELDGEVGDYTPIELQKASVLPDAMGSTEWVRTVLLVGGVLAAFALGRQVFAAGGLGGVATAAGVVAVAAWRLATPLTGWAYTEAAAGHARAAWVTPWYINLNLRRFGSLDEVVDWAEKVRQQQGRMANYLEDRATEGIIAQSFDRHPMDEPLLEDDPALGEDTGRDTGADDADEGEPGAAATDGGGPP